MDCMFDNKLTLAETVRKSKTVIYDINNLLWKMIDNLLVKLVCFVIRTWYWIQFLLLYKTKRFIRFFSMTIAEKLLLPMCVGNMYIGSRLCNNIATHSTGCITIKLHVVSLGRWRQKWIFLYSIGEWKVRWR